MRADGARHGYSSVSVSGAKTNEELMVEWVQRPHDGDVEIVRISSRILLRQDKLLWETNADSPN